MTGAVPRDLSPEEIAAGRAERTRLILEYKNLPKEELIDQIFGEYGDELSEEEKELIRS